MVQPVAPAEEYGLGLGVTREGAVARVGHNGGMPGVRTTLRMYPEHGLVVVVLVNGDVGRDHVRVAQLIEAAMGLPWRSDEICALPSGHPLVRRWEGPLQTVDGPRPVVVEVRESGEVMAALGDAPLRSVRGVAWTEDVLTGWTWGDTAAELGEGSTWLSLDLHLRGDALEGGVSATIPSVATTTMFVRLTPAG
jgi:hypothetical protein